MLIIMNNEVTSLEPIIAKFRAINSFYRSGNVEIFVIEQDNGYLKDEEKTFSFEETQNSKESTLQYVADKLFWEVKKDFWDENKIPKEYLRILTISFEIDEYFINISNKKKEFFDKFRDVFFNFTDDQITQSFVEEKFNSYRKKILEREEAVYIDFAYELMLMCLCGINVLVMKQNVASYQKALRNTHSLSKIIDIILIKEKEDNPNSDKKALGLLGLNHFFKARCYFSLGQFRKAENSFKKSASLYFEKMNLLIASSEPEDAKTRMLALRRACLAEVQLANLYLIESRIDEALEIMERVSPLLTFATGKGIVAYCDLIQISVKRAKFSSNPQMLEGLEKEVKEVKKTIQENVGKSHTYYKAIIEQFLITFYQASEKPTNIKIKSYKNCLSQLAEVIKFGIDESSNRITNRRLAVEAFTMGSHIYRNLAHIESKKFDTHINMALSYANKATKFSHNLKQLKSESQIAIGLIYRDKYEKKDPTLKKNKNKIKIFKKESREHFLTALKINDDDNNNRISAICYLRLAELETIHQNNYSKAKMIFEHFLKYRDKIGHQYVLKFASVLENKINDQKYEKFLFAIEPNEGNLKVSEWQSKLKDYLIAEAIYFAALKYKDNLPTNRRRGESAEIGSQTTENQTTKRNATRQSILAEFIKDEVGITGNERYKIASNHLEDFEYWCEVLKKK